MKVPFFLPFSWATVAALGLICSSLSQAAPADYPRISAGAKVRGEAALERLGRQLPEVAAFYGKSAREMRAIFRRDPKLWLVENGTLDYVCEMDEFDIPNDLGEQVVSPIEETIPLEDTFLLHSRPTATRVIYLDFDGHLTTGMHWNTTYNNGEDIVTPPYDTDGNESTFSAIELQNIQHIWLSVLEDFAAYDVDVTTEEPGVDRLSRLDSSDVEYGIRVCIGGSSSAWYGTAGGVGNVGSFNSNEDKPCFVFPKNLANGNKKYVAEAVSHEVGHTLGLHHDGIAGGTTYYRGHGDWSPIMGIGYYTDVSQWSKGEYPSANNTEDDLAIIQSFIQYRNDDHGELANGATALTGTNIFMAGVIESRTDIDMFSFETGNGTATFTVSGPSPSPNLNIMIHLYNDKKKLLASADFPTLDASLTASLSAGTYYLTVEGVGAGDLSTGYSDYSSIGEYEITGSVISGSPSQAPTAVVSATPTIGTAPLTVAFSSAGSQDPDGTIVSYAWDMGDGSNSSSPNPGHVYASSGNYQAWLVVTDNNALTSSNSVAITVNAPTRPSAPTGLTANQAAPSLLINEIESIDARGRRLRLR